MVANKEIAAQQSNAWILCVSSNQRVAVGQRELLYLTDKAETFDVPLAPAHCRQVLFWQDHMVPLMDIGRWLGISHASYARKFIAILGYQRARGAPPQFGALWLA